MPVVCREIEEVKNQALSVYFIASGGAKPGFKEVYKQVEEPYTKLVIITLYAKVTGKKLLTSFLNKCK